jgi:hypothetical protein
MCMLALAAAFVLQNTTLPNNALVDYSGIPTVTGGNITIQSHSVTLTMAKDHIDVSSLTLVKNNGPAGQVGISLPQFKSGDGPVRAPGFKATWANNPLTLAGQARSDEPLKPWTSTGSMVNLGTYALRISYTLPMGKCDLGHKEFLAAYDLTSPVPIGTLMVTYSYGKGVLFHDPELKPSLGWQIGERGAFLRVDGYDGKAGLSYFASYNLLR